MTATQQQTRRRPDELLRGPCRRATSCSRACRFDVAHHRPRHDFKRPSTTERPALSWIATIRPQCKARSVTTSGSSDARRDRMHPRLRRVHCKGGNRNAYGRRFWLQAVAEVVTVAAAAQLNEITETVMTADNPVGGDSETCHGFRRLIRRGRLNSSRFLSANFEENNRNRYDFRLLG